ncbi:MAG: SGNH/GDSL hydrolase family protein [Kiritimatiellales bacterium]|nr:SGNH/GDSL hydrolase family protein [Kiritimatiellales bacterium]
MKNILINIGLLFASLIFFFGGAEIFLRVTGLQTTKPNPPRIYQQSEHPDISYELIPNLEKEKAYRGTVSTNDLGFRISKSARPVEFRETERSGEPQPKPQAPTIAVFGDSITFGYGVNDDQTLTAQMSSLLPNTNILNTAVPGYNLEQETGVLRQKVEKLDPDLIVLVFYFNDLEGEVGILATDGTLRSQNWDPTQRDCSPIEHGILGYLPGKCWLDEHSAFYKAFKKVIDLRAGKERKAVQQAESTEKPEEDKVTEEQLVRYTQQLNGFISHVPASTPKLFVIWPDQYLHEPTRPRLKQIAEERGFQVLDLYEIFSNEVETLSWDTVHPSPAALEEAAEVIVEAIRQLF